MNTLLQPTTSPIKYFGSKNELAAQLISFMPQDHKTYVEPFAGSLSVLVQKPLSKNEVVNDKDADLINFLLVLRQQRDALIEALSTLPTSRYLFETWRGMEPPADPFQRAVRYFYVMRQTIVSANNALGGWRGGAMKNSAMDYQNAVKRLAAFEERLRGVMIEHLDYADCIQRYDRKDGRSLMYMDPPYHGRESKYAGGFTEADHIKLANLLNSPDFKGRAMVSYYHSPLIDSLYKDWLAFEFNTYIGSDVREVGEAKKVATEVVFLNYDPLTGERLSLQNPAQPAALRSIRGQLALFQ